MSHQIIEQPNISPIRAMFRSVVLIGKAQDKFMHNFTFGVSRFFIASLLVGCLTLAFLAPSNAEDTKADKSTAVSSQTSVPPPSPKPTLPAQPLAPTVNPVTQAAVQSGVLTCVSRINQVTTFLTANGKSSAFLFLPQRQPDQSIFSVSIEIENQNAPTKYASASFAPTTNGQAGAVYDTVEYMTQSCAEVETSMFKGLKRRGILKKDIVMLDGGSVTVFLMPAGSGCVVIKKEVVQ